MFKKIMILFLCMFMILDQAKALDLYIPETSTLPIEIQKLDLASQYSFSFVKEHCQEWGLAFSELTRNGIVTNYELIYNPSERHIKKAWQRGGIGLQLDTILNSQGYYLGLNACFKNNQDKKNLFTMTLIAGDILGIATVVPLSAVLLVWSVLSFVAPSLGVSTMFAFLGKYSWLKKLSSTVVSRLPQTYVTKVSLFFISKYSKYLSYMATLSLVAVPVGLELAQKAEEAKEHQKALDQENHNLQEAKAQYTEIVNDISKLNQIINDSKTDQAKKEKAKEILKTYLDLKVQAHARIQKISALIPTI